MTDETPGSDLAPGAGSGAPSGDSYAILLDIHRQLGGISARMDAKDQKEDEQDARLDKVEEEQKDAGKTAARSGGILGIVSALFVAAFAYLVKGAAS